VRSSIIKNTEAVEKAYPAARHGRRPKASEQSGRISSEREVFFRPVPVPFWVLTLFAAGTAGLTANPSLSAVSILLLPILGSLLWRKGESPILLFCCAMQWLQAVAGVFYADYQDISQHSLFGVSEMDKATWLSLCGVLVLAVGMRLALCVKSRPKQIGNEQGFKDISLLRAFIAWVAAFGVAWIASIFAWRFAGLTQIIYAFIAFKWVFFFVLARLVILKDRGYSLLLIAVAVEFTNGVIGYFGGFKEVLFMLLIVVFSIPGRLSWRSRELVAATTCLVLAASLLWTSVKMEYRAFLNQGTNEQKVTIPVKERFEKLGQLLKDLNRVRLTDNIDDLVMRVSYTMYFAHTLDYVPAIVPYERGQLWFDAIARVFMPRLFFPNKSATNDSLRAEKYTGIKVAGTEEGSSIGIGYMGESYIDFGLYGMFLPIFLLGAFFGMIYRYFAFSSKSWLLGSAIATAILFLSAQKVETSNVKIVGGAVTVCLVMFVFDRSLGPRVMNLLLNKPATMRRSSGRRKRTIDSVGMKDFRRGQ